MNLDIVETRRVDAVLSETTTPEELVSLFFDEKDVTYVTRICILIGKKIWGFSLASPACLKFSFIYYLPRIREYIGEEKVEPILTICADRVLREYVTVTKTWEGFRTNPLWEDDYGFQPDTLETFMGRIRASVAREDAGGTLVPWVKFQMSIQGEHHTDVWVDFSEGAYSALDVYLQSGVKSMVDYAGDCDVEITTYNHILTRFDRPELV